MYNEDSDVLNCCFCCKLSRPEMLKSGAPVPSDFVEAAYESEEVCVSPFAK